MSLILANPITADAIRVPMAALTEETRRDMQKVARNEAENAKVAIRNIRRDVLGDIKALLKEKKFLKMMNVVHLTKFRKSQTNLLLK